VENVLAPVELLLCLENGFILKHQDAMEVIGARDSQRVRNPKLLIQVLKIKIDRFV
jgi:hypothetical protein